VIALDRFAHKLAEKSIQHQLGLLLPTDVAPLPVSGPLPQFKTLVVETPSPDLVRVRLNRPQKLNTIDSVMTGELEQLLGWLAHHTHVRVVALTGEGRAFCAGDDVREVRDLPIDAARQLALRQGRMNLALAQLPQVFIAAINGYCLGGGLTLAYACDLRICSSDARLGMPEIHLGWPPAFCIEQLVQTVGKPKAIEMCLLGEQLSAADALAVGLVTRVVPKNRLAIEVNSLVEKLLALPPIGLRLTKRAFTLNEGSRPKQAMLNDVDLYTRCLATRDAKEGIAAMLEKRPARFTGE
jgi:enoyl-CoA hydratase